MGHFFEARFPGRCGVCDGNIRPGDLATYVEDEIAHSHCPTPVALAEWRVNLLTVDGGTVHLDSCPIAKRATTWQWQARNDGPGVAKACRKCLPDGLPEEDA